LLQGAKEAGFIQPQNLSLVTIIDLESEGEGEQWGTKVVKDLEDWTPPVSFFLLFETELIFRMLDMD